MHTPACAPRSRSRGQSAPGHVPGAPVGEQLGSAPPPGDRVLAGHGVVEHGRVQGRRWRVASTPVALTTSRTASKMRWGRSDPRNRLRQSVSTVGWKPGSSKASPVATFQAMLVRSCWMASRSVSLQGLQHHDRGYHVGRHRRPTRARRKRSANSSSGNSSLRWLAKNPATIRGDQMAAERAASRRCRLGSLEPCTPALTHIDHPFGTDLLSSCRFQPVNATG